MHTIHINLRKENDSSYDILVENGGVSRLPQILKERELGHKYAVITGHIVAEIHARSIMAILQNANIPAEQFVFKAGDENKTLQTAEKLLDLLTQKGFNRKDAIIAFGGGVSGDIAGFVASIYMRGIPFIQVPTTLLAMVDASVGGKTGVNLRAGKNLAGTFYQPRIVLIDPTFLSTLPASEFLNGLSEIVKYAAISSPDMMELIEANKTAILTRDPEIMNKLIIQCCKIKAAVVEEDEKEAGKRMSLNYGHTIGHAIEKLSKYRIPHGQAIAMGMKLINLIASNKGLADRQHTERINNLISEMGLAGPEETKTITRMNPGKVWDAMGSDKKADNKIKFVIVPEIGRSVINNEIEKSDLARALKQYT